RRGRTASLEPRLSARAHAPLAARVDAHPPPCELVVIATVARVAPVSFEGEREDDLEEPGRSEGSLAPLRASEPLVLLVRRQLMEANRSSAERAQARSHQRLILCQTRLHELCVEVSEDARLACARRARWDVRRDHALEHRF